VKPYTEADRAAFMKGSRLAVLEYLRRHADAQGLCVRSYAELARETGYGPRHLMRAVKALVAAEELQVRPRSLGRAANVYQLVTGEQG
jgi:hypothetical protein